MPKPFKKILYIEDDPEARALMSDIIRYKGYVYLEASRGLEGIHLAKQHQPDLILIDLRLPDMQGYEVTTHLKNTPGLAQTPIIALTAETKKNTKEIILTAGCDGYIPKPINVTEFLFKIEEFLAGKRELVKPDEEKHFLQQYNIQLVSRLTKKITELEDLNVHLTGLNNELFESREQLAQYNDRLFYLNNLANQLRTERDPNRLIKILPARMVEGFHIKRCILFELDRDNHKLYPFSSVGEAQSALAKLKIQFSDNFLKKLKDESGIIWIKNINEILDKSLLKLAKKLKSNTFIVGNLSQLGTQSDATSVLQKFALAESSELENAPSRRFMFFLDKGESNSGFETYEIRILKSFMQTVGIIYENILLYSRLMDLYRIREQQAIRDGLTRVYNYRFFMQELEREANRNRRFHTPFSLLMIDVDHFKQFNDSFGHMAGDTVLKDISDLITESTRTTDTVARYGGEEFAVILPGLNKKDSAQIAEKLRVLIDDYEFTEAPTENQNISISIGVASFPEDAESDQELLKLADKALYAAKKSGRNKVSMA